MIDSLVLHDSTVRKLGGFLNKPGNSLMLVGPDGAGKQALSHAVIAQILDVPPEKLDHHRYFLRLQPEDTGSITIDSIRQLHGFVKLKTTGSGNIRRSVLIQDAHNLTIEAQNAFLKLLEEPPLDTLIVMTADTHNSLLPTITSRVPKINIINPAKDSLIKHFGQRHGSQPEVEKAYYISRGQPGLMHQLLSSPDNDESQLKHIDLAKTMLQSTQFERLCQVDQLAKNKQDIGSFVWALQRVASAALYQAIQKNDTIKTRRWTNTLKHILQARDSLKANPQPKLLLTNLLLNL